MLYLYNVGEGVTLASSLKDTTMSTYTNILEIAINKGFDIFILRTEPDEYYVHGIKNGKRIKPFFAGLDYILERYPSKADVIADNYKVND